MVSPIFRNTILVLLILIKSLLLLGLCLVMAEMYLTGIIKLMLVSGIERN
nr:MAG TPA: hypothetical protein [Caudoviricetes sp.]